MKIFAIRDAADTSKKDLAYLLYYETDKRFYIELPENADPWETPLLLSSFVQKGETRNNHHPDCASETLHGLSCFRYFLFKSTRFLNLC